MIIRGFVDIATVSSSSAMTFVLVKRGKSENLNSKIDCVMVQPPSVIEQPVAHLQGF